MRQSLATIGCVLVLAGPVACPAVAEDEPAPLAAPSADAPALPTTIVPRDFVVLPSVGHYGRLPVHRDAVEVQLVTGVWQSPQPGDPVNPADGPPKSWRGATARDGMLETRTIRGGYAFASFDSPAERVMLLEAAGHAAVYVNGQLRTGDPYGLGWLRLPVLVREGENTLLFHVAGDRLSARLVAPPGDRFFMDEDRTLPTLVRGESASLWAAIPVVNATTQWLRGARIECVAESGQSLSTEVSAVPPLSVAKLPFQIPAPADASTAFRYAVRLLPDDGDPPLAATDIELDVAGPSDVHVRTFRSRIDGSVQPYAVRPAESPSGPADDGESALPGMLVTLHDAGVDCATHLSHEEPKRWAHLVAPQGRRPYGFDWEDWGRIDFLEALADAQQHYRADPRRIYLTGRAMGGHGTWHLGVTYPDLFAAIGPSEAWASFWSYGGGMPSFASPTPLESLLLRSYSASDTVQLLGNLSDVGVYVLHDGRDESVPVAQARYMRSRLAGFHTNFAYYEQSEGGPSADADGEWPPMLEFFRRLERPLPGERANVDFATADPGVSSRCDWLTIDAQRQPLAISRAAIRQDADTRAFVGQTTNVERLAIDVGHLPPGLPVDVGLDGQQLPPVAWPENSKRLWFTRSGDQWESANAPSPRVKNSVRNGPFKAAFDRNVLLVYGTGGTEAEDHWAEGKARYDAETFWYRGGGRLEIVPDAEFDPAGTSDRSIILYGNADTNSAWPHMLEQCPVQVRRGEVRVGGRREIGDDLAVLMVFPRFDSDVAAVGVVAGTGPVGMEVANRLRYFVSGVAYPDLMIVDSSALLDGISSIQAWGYFDAAWSIDDRELLWRDRP